MKWNIMWQQKNMKLAAAVLVASVLLSGCSTLQSEASSQSSFNSLSDPKSELTYSTAFPVASAEEAIIRGDEALLRNDLNRALFEYVRALEKRGADAELLYKVGRVHVLRKDSTRAELAFILALKEKSDHTGALAELGRIQMKNRNYNSAKKLLEKALLSEPTSSRILNALGVLEDITKNHEQAQNYFTRALVLDGDNPVYLNNLGYSRYLMGYHEAAKQAFNDALKMKPDYTRAWRNLGLVYANSGKFLEALDAFGKVEEDYRAYNDVGYLAMLAGRYADADYFFQQAIRLAPMYYDLANRNVKNLDVIRHKQNRIGN